MKGGMLRPPNAYLCHRAHSRGRTDSTPTGGSKTAVAGADDAEACPARTPGQRPGLQSDFDVHTRPLILLFA